MEHINLAYSLKNIPIPSYSTYKLLLTEKIESLIKRMRRKAHFYLKGINNQDNTNNFNLKSRKCSPICKDMQAFENDLTDMVKNIKFTNHWDNFLKKIINDTKKIHYSNKIFILADKTTNLYSTNFANNKKLTSNKVTQTYKKATETTMNNINKEAKEMAPRLNIDHKINSIAEQPAFITIKDHGWYAREANQIKSYIFRINVYRGFGIK